MKNKRTRSSEKSIAYHFLSLNQHFFYLEIKEGNHILGKKGTDSKEETFRETHFSKDWENNIKPYLNYSSEVANLVATLFRLKKKEKEI